MTRDNNNKNSRRERQDNVQKKNGGKSYRGKSDRNEPEEKSYRKKPEGKSFRGKTERDPTEKKSSRGKPDWNKPEENTFRGKTKRREPEDRAPRGETESDKREGKTFRGKTEGRTFRGKTEGSHQREKTNAQKKDQHKPGDKVKTNLGAQKDKRSGKKSSAFSSDMRLNKFIANAGICSRREADRYIETGLVTVNGKIVTELGIKVTLNDEVKFDGRKLTPEKKIYLLMNKPKNFVTTTDDPHAEKTVMDLIRNACPERIYPVGRLDKNTTGILLFTNDGEMSKRLTHPSFNNKKIYQVSLDKPVTKLHIQEISEGIELEDGVISSDAISYIDANSKQEVGIEIHSGKNRIVRRIFEHFGYNVRKLDRVYFAGLTKKNLPRGKWRFLTENEISFLKMK